MIIISRTMSGQGLRGRRTRLARVGGVCSRTMANVFSLAEQRQASMIPAFSMNGR
jgi:hypothetical protein